MSELNEAFMIGVRVGLSFLGLIIVLMAFALLIAIIGIVLNKFWKG